MFAHGNVLVLGGGGREHAITHKLVQSCHVNVIYVSPGNGGICLLPKSRCVELNVDDVEQICAFCLEHQIRLVVIGPEKHLQNGLSDQLASKNIQCFGPTQRCARLETNKCEAKNLMVKLDIPTARYRNFNNAQEAKEHIRSCNYDAWVVKACGLAAGKGVHVATSDEDACRAVEDFIDKKVHGEAGSQIVVEELLVGKEISAMCFSDGSTVRLMPMVQDYKRLLAGNKGPNTGGMGATCPYRMLSEEEVDFTREQIMMKVIKHLRNQGDIYKGVLYVGLMKTESGLRVLEFNCRFGDPETQVLMPLLRSDLSEVMLACINGTLSDCKIFWQHDRCAVGIVLASEGYPSSPRLGYIIHGLQEAENLAPDSLVYHCGTRMTADHSELITNGGRVLCVVGLGCTEAAAKLNAFSALKCIDFEGRVFRRDIGNEGWDRGSSWGSCTNLATAEQYLESGVDLNIAQQLVNAIRPWCLQTVRSGTLASEFGGFGCSFDAQSAGYTNPLLITSTDGVGTKLRISIDSGIFETIGIDLVAMSVNDILTQNAEPLIFLDYIGMNKVSLDVVDKIMKGIADGCKQANCCLIGGETAEMNDLYSEGDFDLVGFATGVLEKGRDCVLPTRDKIAPGDRILALPSSGFHSNGFTLIRRIMDVRNLKLTDPCPWNEKITLANALLTPTKIYVNAILTVLRSGLVKAAVHVTGGGLVDNIPRVLNKNVCAVLDALAWPIAEPFLWLSTVGQVSPEEMVHVFNCGLGMLLIVDEDNVARVERMLRAKEEQFYRVGLIKPFQESPQAVVEHLKKAFDKSATPTIQPSRLSKKQVAVLISGEGTNMLALINYAKKHCCSYKVALVVSNKKQAAGLQKAAQQGITCKFIPSAARPADEFENELQLCLLENQIDIVCLAGFMRILSDKLTSRWAGKMVNVHPSLLPSFKGLNAPRQALKAGVRITGATIHFVEETVDSGGIILQAAVQVFPDDSENTLSRRIKLVEHKIYPKAVERLANGLVTRESASSVRWSRGVF